MQKQWSIDEAVIQRCRGWQHWQGSHYELSMAYSRASLPQQERLRLFHTVWADANLLGVVDDPEKFGQPWQGDTDRDVADARHSYGCVRLTESSISGCASYFSSSGDTTWFSLYIPLGLLGQVFPVHYPLTYEANPWTKIVDARFAAIGMRVYRAMPFQLAVLGEEASAVPLKSILTNLAHDPGLLVPEALFRQRGEVPYGVRSPEGLWWTGGNDGTTGREFGPEGSENT